MAEAVEIYGKDACPYTAAARREYAARGLEVRYFDVKRDRAAMARFLELSGGDRRVPLIVERGRVSSGFGGS
ncbi:UXX-star selenoprotein family 1 [Anaeromyxobacter sp. Red801]|uniref:UXX-star selenoprotein family 1 n=1 Tax=Anaeromyxobacter sp. Red801 TaxID=3411632 RepID=UPI003BA2E178